MTDACSAGSSAREIPAAIVYEDDDVLAFKDINPQAPLHALVVPRAPHPDAQRSPAGGRWLVGEMVRRAAAIAARTRLCGPAAIRTVFNYNRDAGQTVFHIHLHLLGGRGLAWPPG